MSLWHLLMIPIAGFPFYGIPISLFIWYRTKDPNNRWLKILYRCRFVYGILVIFTVIPIIINFVNDNSNVGDTAPVFLGMVFGKFIIAWCFMRRWGNLPSSDHQDSTNT
jgi:hypothetical protein